MGVAAVYWEPGEPCTLIGRGEGFIIIEWRKTVIARVYFSPNGEENKFKELLGELNRIIGSAINKKVLIEGDFNARSRGWDKTYNKRGYILEEWLRGKGLIIANKEREFTCVRAQGSSVVDLMLCTPALIRKMESWEVKRDIESLSDHRYIIIEIQERNNDRVQGNRKRGITKWNIKSMISIKICSRHR